MNKLDLFIDHVTNPGHKSEYVVLIFGTSPSNGRGGISTAIKNLISAFGNNNIIFKYYCTHDANKAFKSFWPFMHSIAFFLSDIFKNKYSKANTVAFLHVGPNASLVRKLILSILLNRLGIKIATQYHSPKFFVYLNSIFGRIALKHLANFSDVNIALSGYWKNLFETHGFPNVLTIGNMSPTPSFDTNLYQVRANKEITILTMCRLDNGKSVDCVIKASQYLPENYIILICGAGKLSDSLINLSKQLGLKHRIRFLGWVENDKKIKLLSQAQVFCLPSEYESFGMGYIEAMSYGCPVIGRNIPQTRAIINNNVLGSLWNGVSHKELAELIVNEVKKDTLQKRVERQTHFRDNFNELSILNKLHNAFKEVLVR